MAYQFTDADRNLLKQAQANKSSLDQRQQRQLEALQKIDLIQQANRQTKAPYAQPNQQEQTAARQELGRQMKTATETMEKSRAKNLSKEDFQFRQAVVQEDNRGKAGTNRFQNESSQAQWNKNIEALRGMSDEDLKDIRDYVKENTQMRERRASSSYLEYLYENHKTNKAFQKISEKYGEQRARELAETVDWIQSEQEAEEARELGQAAGSGSILEQAGGTALSVGTNLVGSIKAPLDYMDEAVTRTGQYDILNPNNAGATIKGYGNAVRETVTDEIQGDGNNALRNAGAVVYQAGTQMADSMARAYLFGRVGAPIVAAGGEAGDALQDASSRGVTPGKAALYAAGKAGIGYVTDKIPMENLFKIMKDPQKGGVKVAINLIKQGLAEGIPETAGDWLSSKYDELINGDKAARNLRIAELIENGKSAEEAKEIVAKEQEQDLINTFIVSFTSGFMSGGVGEVVGRRKNRAEAGKAGEKTEVSPVTGEQVQTQADTQAATDTQTDTDTQADVQAEAQQAREDQGQQDRAMEAQAENARQEAAQARQEAQQQSQDVLTEIAQGMARDLPQQEQQAPSDPGMEAVNRAAAETYGVQQEQLAGDVQMQENLQEQQGAEPGQKFSRIVPDDGKGAGKKYSGKAKSQYYENTGVKSTRENINQATQFVNENNEEATYHDVHNQRHIEKLAKKQTSTPEGVARSYERLIQKSKFDDQDVATAKAIIDKMWASGDAEASAAMTSKLASQIGDAARVMRTAQNNTIYDARSPKAAVESFIKQIDQMKPEDTTFKPGSQGAEKAKTAVTEIGFEIENAKTADDVREIIRQLAVKRKTTAWFGLTNRLSADAQYMINKMGVDDLKVVANWQIASMADDFRKRSKTEILMGIRKNNMLMSMKTFLRNLGGNAASGVLDAFSSSTSGRMADAVLSKFTGVRTVGNEIKQSGKYLKGALDGTKFAAMCVELNIPIETDIRGLSEGLGKDNKFVGKTWTSNGNFMQRFLYANQKWMSYALEVSDKLFEGGTNSQVAASLESMNSNLTEEQASDIAEFESNRRTFKDGTWDDDDGHHGAVLSQAAQGLKNGDFIKSDKARKAYKAGADIVMPFASVPMNVAQTGIDYTVGIAKGAYEIAGIIKDAKAGMEINPVRQRQAASDFGRGMTGVGMVALFAVAKNFGVLRVSDDENRDKKALEQSEGLSGAQINWSALGRVFEWESGEWQDGDGISTVDFLEPFNTQIYLGAQLAEDESVMSLSGVAGATAKSVMDSLLDSPMMTGISEIVEISQNVNDAEDPADIGQELARYGGDVAGSFIPQFVRQGAQLADGYYRDTRGSTQAETAKNSIISAIPGASQDLPRKYDGLGQVQERPGFLGTFVDPTYTKEYHPNEVTRFLEEISGQTGDMGIYPGRQAPMSLTIDGETVSLDGTQRETYQKTYGEKVNEYYRGLMDNDAFRKLTPELQAEALKKAKGYAGDFAKASVSGYTDTPKGTSGEITGKIVTDTILGSMNGIFSGFDEDISKGKSTGDLAKAMEDTYRQLMNIPESQREKAVEIQGGTVANYYDARKNGVSSEDFAAALGAIGSAEKTGSIDKKTGEARRTNSDIYGAIAGAGLDDKTADAIMRAYMPDYDPENGSTEKTEVKYDFIRALGLSPEEYAQVYRANGTSSKKAGKIEAFRELGYDARMADLLYKIFAGNQDVADKMLEWYESR